MRPRLLAPLPVLLALACPPAGETMTTGFDSAPTTTGGPGPSSFGTSGDTSSGDTPTTPTTEPSTTTGEPGTTSEPGTASTSDTGTTSTNTATTTTTGTSGTTDTTDTTTTSDDTGTSGGAPVCGNGVLDGDELCDDGNMSDDDICLNDCTPGAAVLALIGAGTQAGFIATFTPGSGWTTKPAPMGIAEADLETTPEGALAVIRRASAVPAQDGELFYARWQPADPALFTMYATVGEFGFAKDGPSIGYVADTVTLAFLGTDNKHYTALYTENGWAAFTKLPAGMVQLQAFGPSAAAIAPGQIEVYAAYTGDDARIYYSMKFAPGSAWQASSATPPPSVLGPPVGIVDDQGDLILAYVRKSDGKVALSKLLTPQNAWAPEAILDDTAITSSEIAFIRLATGSYALAWRGFDNEGIYLATGSAYDTWDTLGTVELPQGITGKPALVHGVAGADLEILYTAAGKLRHARVTDGQAVAPIDVPGITGATSAAATLVYLAP